jgi:hypothetical protein
MIEAMSTTAPTLPRVKGVSFKSNPESLRRVGGERALDQMHAALPDELRDAVRYGRIVAGGWYPLAWLQACQEATQTALAEGPEVHRRLSRVNTREHFRTGVYRFVAVVLAPQSLLELAPRIFNYYYDRGRLEVLEARPGGGKIRFSGCVGFNRSNWQSVLGGCEGVLEAAGARNLIARIHAGGDVGETMDASFHWTKP